jgi:vacuolar protein sorting-associated protein 45
LLSGFSKFHGVHNSIQVYTQHVPLLINTLNLALKGKLRDKPSKLSSEATFPATGPIPSVAPKCVVAFVVGGVTYEEGTKVAEMNISSPIFKVILGGTTIHNSTTFLRELGAMP